MTRVSKKVVLTPAVLSLKLLNKYTKIESLEGDAFYESMDLFDVLLMKLLYKYMIVGKENRVARKILRYADRLARRYLKDLSELTPQKRHKIIKKFAKHNKIPITPGRWEKPLADYLSRDAFFSRKYHPDHPNHPVKVFHASQNDPKAFCSPCECKIVAYASVQESTEFWIKHKKFQLANVGLGVHWRRYEQHPMCIFRLAMYDYHRYHAPVSGKIVESRAIETSKVTHTVQPVAWKNKRLNLLNDNKRHLLTIRTKDGHHVALVIVGAPAVMSIQFNQRIKVGAKVTRGEDLGSFHFGGSTVAMFCDTDTLHFDPRILKKSRAGAELQLKCGQKIARF